MSADGISAINDAANKATSAVNFATINARAVAAEIPNPAGKIAKSAQDAVDKAGKGASPKEIATAVAEAALNAAGQLSGTKPEVVHHVEPFEVHHVHEDFATHHGGLHGEMVGFHGGSVGFHAGMGNSHGGMTGFHGGIGNAHGGFEAFHGGMAHGHGGANFHDGIGIHDGEFGEYQHANFFAGGGHGSADFGHYGGGGYGGHHGFAHHEHEIGPHLLVHPDVHNTFHDHHDGFGHHGEYGGGIGGHDGGIGHGDFGHDNGGFHHGGFLGSHGALGFGSGGHHGGYGGYGGGGHHGGYGGGHGGGGHHSGYGGGNHGGYGGYGGGGYGGYGAGGYGGGHHSEGGFGHGEFGQGMGGLGFHHGGFGGHHGGLAHHEGFGPHEVIHHQDEDHLAHGGLHFVGGHLPVPAFHGHEGLVEDDHHHGMEEENTHGGWEGISEFHSGDLVERAKELFHHGESLEHHGGELEHEDEHIEEIGDNIHSHGEEIEHEGDHHFPHGHHHFDHGNSHFNHGEHMFHHGAAMTDHSQGIVGHENSLAEHGEEMLHHGDEHKHFGWHVGVGEHNQQHDEGEAEEGHGHYHDRHREHHGEAHHHDPHGGEHMEKHHDEEHRYHDHHHHGHDEHGSRKSLISGSPTQGIDGSEVSVENRKAIRQGILTGLGRLGISLNANNAQAEAQHSPSSTLPTNQGAAQAAKSDLPEIWGYDENGNFKLIDPRKTAPNFQQPSSPISNEINQDIQSIGQYTGPTVNGIPLASSSIGGKAPVINVNTPQDNPGSMSNTAERNVYDVPFGENANNQNEVSRQQMNSLSNQHQNMDELPKESILNQLKNSLSALRTVGKTDVVNPIINSKPGNRETLENPANSDMFDMGSDQKILQNSVNDLKSMGKTDVALPDENMPSEGGMQPSDIEKTNNAENILNGPETHSHFSEASDNGPELGPSDVPQNKLIDNKENIASDVSDQFKSLGISTDDQQRFDDQLVSRKDERPNGETPPREETPSHVETAPAENLSQEQPENREKEESSEAASQEAQRTPVSENQEHNYPSEGQSRDQQEKEPVAEEHKDDLSENEPRDEKERENTEREHDDRAYDSSESKDKDIQATGNEDKDEEKAKDLLHQEKELRHRYNAESDDKESDNRNEKHESEASDDRDKNDDDEDDGDGDDDDKRDKTQRDHEDDRGKSEDDRDKGDRDEDDSERKRQRDIIPKHKSDETVSAHNSDFLKSFSDFTKQLSILEDNQDLKGITRDKIANLKYFERLAHLGTVEKLFQIRSQISNKTAGRSSQRDIKLPDYKAKLFKLRENLEHLTPEVVKGLLTQNEYYYIKGFLDSEKAFENHMDLSEQVEAESIRNQQGDIGGDRRSSEPNPSGNKLLNFFKDRAELFKELEDAVEDPNLEHKGVSSDGEITSNFFPWKLKNEYDNKQFEHYRFHSSKENPFKNQPITKLHTPVGNDNFFDFNHLANALNQLGTGGGAFPTGGKFVQTGVPAQNGTSTQNGTSDKTGFKRTEKPGINEAERNQSLANQLNILDKASQNDDITLKTNLKDSPVLDFTAQSRVIDPEKKKEESTFGKYAPQSDGTLAENERLVPLLDVVTGHVKNLPDKDDYPQDKAMEEVTIKPPKEDKDDATSSDFGLSGTNNLTSSDPQVSNHHKPVFPYSNKLESYLKSHKVEPKLPHNKPMPYIGEGEIYTPSESSFIAKTPTLSSTNQGEEPEKSEASFQSDLSNQKILENLIKEPLVVASKRQDIHPLPLHVVQLTDDVIRKNHDVTPKQKEPLMVYTAKRAETVNGRKDFMNMNKPGENPFGPHGLHRDIIQNVLKQYKKEEHKRRRDAKRRAIMELHKLKAFNERINTQHKKRRKRLPVVFQYNGQDDHVNIKMHEWDDIDVWPHAHGENFDHEFDHHAPDGELQVKAQISRLPKTKMVDVVATKKTAIIRNLKNDHKIVEAAVIDSESDDVNNESDIDEQNGSSRSEIKNESDFDPQIEEDGSGGWTEVHFSGSGDQEETVDFPASEAFPKSTHATFVTEVPTKKSLVSQHQVRTEKFFENTKVSFDGTDNYVSLPSHLYFEKFNDDTVDELPNVGQLKLKDETKIEAQPSKLSAEHLLPSEEFESLAPDQSALSDNTPANEKKDENNQKKAQRIGESELRYYELTSSLNRDNENENKDGGLSFGSVKHDIESDDSDEGSGRNEAEPSNSIISADTIGDLGNGNQKQKTSKKSLDDGGTGEKSDVTKFSNVEEAEDDEPSSLKGTRKDKTDEHKADHPSYVDHSGHVIKLHGNGKQKHDSHKDEHVFHNNLAEDIDMAMSEPKWEFKDRDFSVSNDHDMKFNHPHHPAHHGHTESHAKSNAGQTNMYEVLTSESKGKHSKRHKSTSTKDNTLPKKCINGEGCTKRQFESPPFFNALHHNDVPFDLKPYYENLHHSDGALTHHHGGLHTPGLGGHGTYRGPQYPPNEHLDLYPSDIHHSPPMEIDHTDYYDDVELPHVTPIDHMTQQSHEVLTSSQYHPYTDSVESTYGGWADSQGGAQYGSSVTSPYGGSNHPVDHLPHRYPSTPHGESIPHLIDRLTTTRRCEGTDCKDKVTSLGTNQKSPSDLIGHQTENTRILNHVVKLANHEASLSEELTNPKQGKSKETNENYLGGHVIESLKLGAQIKRKNDTLKHLQEILQPENKETVRLSGHNEMTHHLKETKKMQKSSQSKNRPKINPTSPNVVVMKKPKGQDAPQGLNKAEELKLKQQSKPKPSKETDIKKMDSKIPDTKKPDNVKKPDTKKPDNVKKPVAKKTNGKKKKQKQKVYLESALGKEGKKVDSSKVQSTAKVQSQSKGQSSLQSPKKPETNSKKPSNKLSESGKSGKHKKPKQPAKIAKQSSSNSEKTPLKTKVKAKATRFGDNNRDANKGTQAVSETVSNTQTAVSTSTASQQQAQQTTSSGYNQDQTHQPTPNEQQTQPQDTQYNNNQNQPTPPNANNAAVTPQIPSMKPKKLLNKALLTKLKSASLSQMKYFTAMTSLLLHHINKNVNKTRQIAVNNPLLGQQPSVSGDQQIQDSSLSAMTGQGQASTTNTQPGQDTSTNTNTLQNQGTPVNTLPEQGNPAHGLSSQGQSVNTMQGQNQNQDTSAFPQQQQNQPIQQQHSQPLSQNAPLPANQNPIPFTPQSTRCGKKPCTSSELGLTKEDFSSTNNGKESGFVKTHENILPTFFKPRIEPKKRPATLKVNKPKELFIVLGVSHSMYSRLHFSDLFNYALDLFGQSLDYYGYQRAAFLTFGGPSYYYVPLTNRSEFSVNRTLKGYRNLTSALNFVVQTMEPLSNGRRQLVTILPDRFKKTDNQEVEKVKENLQKHGFEMYCVGVGKSFDKDKTSIKMLASKPIHDHTIKASYNSLNKTMPLLFKKLSLDRLYTKTQDKHKLKDQAKQIGKFRHFIPNQFQASNNNNFVRSYLPNGEELNLRNKHFIENNSFVRSHLSNGGEGNLQNEHLIESTVHAPDDVVSVTSSFGESSNNNNGKLRGSPESNLLL
uniref:VWFA domain-containing protein n=1 Tax=Clytia hemisphaerica TaxID=252671 RepID=A0A7M5UV00_9CNID